MNNPPHGPPGFDREREAIDEQRRAHAIHQQEELAQQRVREHNERQERERREREQYQATPTHQNDAGSIPIHQPVASRLPGAIHSPGGLLANHGGPPPPGPLGAPSGPGNAFGGPLHGEPNRALPHNPQNATAQLQQQPGFGPNILHHGTAPNLGAPGAPAVNFGGPLQQQPQPPQDAIRLQQLSFGAPMPQGHPIAGQSGQQPILNDALSYLDQVKVQFADQPDVYNRFLDIMKDFKSQAIDTPGVINRVSELFAGHPNLIQGFNTFLPHGYRIECGTGNDPNSIRVTTPMGTTVQSIQGGRALPGSVMGPGANGSSYYGQARPGNWQQEPQHSIESPEAVFSPQNQNSAPPYAQANAQSAYDAQQAAAAAAHQQQQRGVSQLTNAVATLGHPPRNAQTPTPGTQAGLNGGQTQGNPEKRGPVEFNHAISYVNKIKNRFQDRPEIYKQFLEILQTYQRESKPIQDVYAQVTFLFNSAPDLLEDFKQFLPESAAQAKAAAAAKAAEESALGNQTPQTSNARGEGKLPPVGNFSVAASANKDNKKRQRTNIPAPTTTQANASGEAARGGPPGVANKRNKLSHPNKVMPSDIQAVSPTLTPVVPEPLPPTTTSGATAEELAFFDRVKKYIGNKQTMNEFLKLCNLFSQDLIDRNVLVFRVSSFIGGNTDLMNWFKAFVGYEGNDEIIENRPKPPTGRPALSNCRGLGPSYRLLPKRLFLPTCLSFTFNPNHSDFDTIVVLVGTSKVIELKGFCKPAHPSSSTTLTTNKREHFAFVCTMPEPEPEPVMISFDHHGLYFSSTIGNYVVDDEVVSYTRGLLVESKRFDDLVAGEKRPSGRGRKAERAEYNARQDKRKKLNARAEYLGELTEIWQERHKPCSGRDELCNSVLNDDWASHPTWASEDSGFVAHRKNAYEESLHRIEEERHDYDFNIEANAKVIQLLEPVAQTIIAMTPEERAVFRLPLGLGTPARSIYNRVLKKIYGTEGPRVVQELFEDPCAVLPVILPRLKQKDEEWRTSQREWEKIWHNQTNHNYLRSLDHQGIHVKGLDKKSFANKAIIDAIKAKHEEQRRQRGTHARKVDKHQYHYTFSDQEVITDLLRIMILYVNNASQHNVPERRRISEFFETFVSNFFGISRETIRDSTGDVDRVSVEEEDEDTTADLPNGGRKKPVNGKKNAMDLRRDVLNKKTVGRSRAQKEGSASGSKESTPDVESVLDEEPVEPADDPAVSEVSNERWANVPGAMASQGTEGISSAELGTKSDQPFARETYKLIANSNIFIFFHIFANLYQRLKTIKDSEDEVKEDEKRVNLPKPAKELGAIPPTDDFFYPLNTQFGETYYARTLKLIDDFIANDLEEPRYQEFLRNYYLRNGWRLYSITDLLKSLCKVGAICSGSDSKDKTPAILEQFYKNRANEETTYNTEIKMRKQAEKYTQGGELFLIEFATKSFDTTIQWLQRDDTTEDMSGLGRMEHWQYYTSSYVSVEPTEGVDRARLKKVILTRNIPNAPDTYNDDGNPFPKPLIFEEHLLLRICVNTTKLVYVSGGSEYFVWIDKPMGVDNETEESNTSQRIKNRTARRAGAFQEKFVMNNNWMKDKNHDEVNERTKSFKLAWVENNETAEASSSST